jgi:hypothetical protein
VNFISRFLRNLTQTSPWQILRRDERENVQTERAIMRDWEEAIRFEAKLLKRDFIAREEGWAAPTLSKITSAEMHGRWVKDDFNVEAS